MKREKTKMIRRFNYTSRARINKSDALITFDESTKPLSFNACLHLDKYNLEPTARVFVEAYRGNSFMRFDYGTVEALAPPENRQLLEIEGDEFSRFRVKIVDGESGRLFAISPQLMPGGDSRDQREALLPMYLANTGNQIWRLKFENEGVRLELNQHKNGIQRTPEFRALVFPSVVREVLSYIIFIEKQEREEEPEDGEKSSWGKWLEFISGFYPEEYPGPYRETESADIRNFLDWIEGAVEAFCAKNKIAEGVSDV